MAWRIPEKECREDRTAIVRSSHARKANAYKAVIVAVVRQHQVWSIHSYFTFHFTFAFYHFYKYLYCPKELLYINFVKIVNNPVKIIVSLYCYMASLRGCNNKFLLLLLLLFIVTQ